MDDLDSQIQHGIQMTIGAPGENTYTIGNEAGDAVTLTAINGFDTVAVEKMTFQIGANGSGDQRVQLSVANMGVWNLGDRTYEALDSTGLSGGQVAFVDVRTRVRANDSIVILDAAINQVSGTRADLGALQNRLEHTLNNLGVTKENLTAAESSIRDVDMAKEMMDFTKNNILVQASQAMLAQANQLPQGVLQLLR